MLGFSSQPLDSKSKVVCSTGQGRAVYSRAHRITESHFLQAGKAFGFESGPPAPGPEMYLLALTRVI